MRSHPTPTRPPCSHPSPSVCLTTSNVCVRSANRKVSVVETSIEGGCKVISGLCNVCDVRVIYNVLGCLYWFTVLRTLASSSLAAVV